MPSAAWMPAWSATTPWKIYTLQPAFGFKAGGLGPDNRTVGDSWKLKPNLTLSLGLGYDRDTGRTDRCAGDSGNQRSLPRLRERGEAGEYEPGSADWVCLGSA